MTHAATGAHTPTTENAAFEHYPLYCYHLSPTITQWCPLRACDIHELAQRRGFEGQDDTFFHLNHPIRWVRVVGVVVAVDQYYGRRVYTIDDGSGACIECATTVPTPKTPAEEAAAATAAAPEDTQDPHADIDVGRVVEARGGLALYRQQKQIRVTRLRRVASTAAEVAFWHRIRAFAADVLARPWVVDARQRRRLEKEARRDVVGDRAGDGDAGGARRRPRRHRDRDDRDENHDHGDDAQAARKRRRRHRDEEEKEEEERRKKASARDGIPPWTGNSLLDEARQRRTEKRARDATPADVPPRGGSHSSIDEARKERRTGDDATSSGDTSPRTGNSLHDEACQRRKHRPTGNDATPNDMPPRTSSSLRDEARQQRRKERPTPAGNDEKPDANGIPPRTGNSLLDEARRRRREKAERLRAG